MTGFRVLRVCSWLLFASVVGGLLVVPSRAQWIEPPGTGWANLTVSHQDTRDRFDENGSVSSTQSFSGRLDLQSRLRRDLTADLITNYNRTETGVTDVQTIDSKLSLRYRPSELLALRGSYTKAFGDFERKDILELGGNLRLLLTPKTRLTLSVSHRQQDESRQTIGLLGDWEISRNLFLQGRGSYFLAERNSYNFGLNLSFRL